jgi:hypothetical protein
VLEAHGCCRLQELPAGARDAYMLRWLLDDFTPLSALGVDRTAALRRAAFVPTRAGGLAAPGGLCDPRVAELTALLDPNGKHFPAGRIGASDEVSISPGYTLQRLVLWHRRSTAHGQQSSLNL